jgi:hypothetical protein
MHYLASDSLGHPVLLNKLIGALLQLIGGLSILVGINQNLGTFRNHGLLTLVSNWFRSFPLFKKPTIVGFSASILGGATIEAVGRVTKKCRTLEEEIEEMKRQIDDCRNLIYEKEKLQNQRLENLRKEMHSSISGVQVKVDKLSSQVEETTVGGVDLQIFGLILLGYGAILSVFL